MVAPTRAKRGPIAVGYLATDLKTNKIPTQLLDVLLTKNASSADWKAVCEDELDVQALRSAAVANSGSSGRHFLQIIPDCP
jgi:hypothetical protein